MRTVITGHNGQLGRQLISAFGVHDVLPLDLPDDDITDPAVIERIARFAPQLIVHGAAFTDVDGAERTRSWHIGSTLSERRTWHWQHSGPARP